MTAKTKGGRPKVLVVHPIAPSALETLNRHAEVDVWAGPHPIGDQLRTQLVGHEGLLSMLTTPVDAELLQLAPSLRVVSNMAVGYDNIDVAAATELGIVVTNTPDVLTDAVAELTWALILAMARRVVPAHQALLAGQWRYWAPDGFLGTELSGKTLLVVGMGRIGQAVAAKAPAFGMRVLSVEGHGQGDWPQVPLDEGLASADVVTLHVPLTAETAGLVGHAWLSKMKRGSLLVNTARGGLVDEGALLTALDSDRVGGAALDVFAQEPVDGSHPLARHPRVLAVPHIGSATVETRRRMAERAVANLTAALLGERPPDLVNPEVWGHQRG